MMKALFVLHSAAPSGAELAVVRLVENLRGTVDVTTVFLEDGPMVERLRADGADAAVLDGRFDSRAMTIEGRAVKLPAKTYLYAKLGPTFTPSIQRPLSRVRRSRRRPRLPPGRAAARPCTPRPTGDPSNARAGLRTPGT